MRLILFIILLISTVDCQDNVQLVEIIDEILSSHLDVKISSVNLISSSDNPQLNDLMTELIVKIASKKSIMRINEENLQKLTQQRLIFNVIIVDSLKNFKKLVKKFTNGKFNYGGYYVILFKTATYAEAHEIFQSLWDVYIYNVNLIRCENDSFIVETFVPFQHDDCNKTNPVEIARYANGQFTKEPSNFFPKKFENFHRCPLKITTFASLAPAILSHNFPNGSFDLYGRDVELFKTLASELNFHANVTYLPTYGSWGVVYSNGTTTGAMGNAKRREADFTLGNLNLKLDRSLIMDFSFGYYLDTLIFVIPRGQPYSSFHKLLLPFDRIVWMSLFVTILLSAAIIALILCQKRKVKRFVFGHGINYPFLNMLIALFGGSQNKLPIRNFARYLLMSFLMFCFVIRSLYQGSLYQFLQSSDSQPEVESIDEMSQLDYKFYMIASYDDMTRTSQPMKDKRVIITPAELKPKMEKTLDVKFKGTLLVAISEVLYKNKLRAHSREELFTVCKVRFLLNFFSSISNFEKFQQLFTMIPITIYYPKDSYLVGPFDEKLIWLQCSGLISHWASQEVDYRYLSYSSESTGPRAMTLEHLLGTFQIWIFMCIFAFMIFLLELTWKVGNIKLQQRKSATIKLVFH